MDDKTSKKIDTHFAKHPVKTRKTNTCAEDYIDGLIGEVDRLDTKVGDMSHALQALIDSWKEKATTFYKMGDQEKHELAVRFVHDMVILSRKTQPSDECGECEHNADCPNEHNIYVCQEHNPPQDPFHCKIHGCRLVDGPDVKERTCPECMKIAHERLTHAFGPEKPFTP